MPLDSEESMDSLSEIEARLDAIEAALRVNLAATNAISNGAVMRTLTDMASWMEARPTTRPARSALVAAALRRLTLEHAEMN